MKNKRLRYSERAIHCENALAKSLLELMDNKKTNLAISADLTRCESVLELANKTGPEICLFKTHADILEDFSQVFTEELKKIARKHSFFIFEDRKFADIGNTVKHQYEGGIYQIADWADIINAHSLPGPGIVQGLQEIGLPKKRALLLLAEMSSEYSLSDPIYAKKTLEMAEQFPEFVIGFICQRKLSNDTRWIYMTPGIQMVEGKDELGQQYITPKKAIENGTDIIIVGRGIIHAGDPLQAAQRYRQAGWDAYSALVS